MYYDDEAMPMDSVFADMAREYEKMLQGVQNLETKELSLKGDEALLNSKNKNEIKKDIYTENKTHNSSNEKTKFNEENERKINNIDNYKILNQILSMELCSKEQITNIIIEKGYHRSLNHCLSLKSLIIEHLEKFIKKEYDELSFSCCKTCNMQQNMKSLTQTKRSLIDCQFFLLEKYDFALTLFNDNSINEILKVNYWASRCLILLQNF